MSIVLMRRVKWQVTLSIEGIEYVHHSEILLPLKHRVISSVIFLIVNNKPL